LSLFGKNSEHFSAFLVNIAKICQHIGQKCQMISSKLGDNGEHFSALSAKTKEVL